MKKISLLLLSFIFSFHASAQFGENPVRWNCKVEDNAIVINASIDAPWHMYDLGPYKEGPNATTIKFSFPEGVSAVGDIQTITEPTRYFDEMFQMEIGYFEKKAQFRQEISNTTSEKQQVTIDIEWQCCDDQSCLPPSEKQLKVSLPSSSQPAVAASENPSGNQSENTSGKSIWSVILEAILWGFAALLTPCVFPMVPMTVSFFMKGSKSQAKGRFHASVYGLSIVILYTVPIALIIALTYMIGGDAVTADIFNWLATHWLPNILFFVIFMIFAASFFGAFEITMPSKLVNGSDSKADRGGILGVFFMALTLVLVSFSCTGPIVGTILVKSTQGEIWEPIVTMLAFSIAFALPFTLLAFFPSVLKKLPKSGGWLNTIKVTLGFIELALGMKFLSVADQTYHWGILDRETYLAFWIVIFALMGFYFLGKIRFANDDKIEKITVKRLVAAIITFAFVVYMIPGMWGAPLKALSGYMPPLSSQDFVMGSPVKVQPSIGSEKPKYSDFLHLPHGLQGFFDYDEAVAFAKKSGKPLFIDFTGHGCVNCREMEANVWSDGTVQSILTEKYVILALYVDDKKELPESEWITASDGSVSKTIGKVNAQRQIRMFGTNAQPYYCLMNPETESLLVDPRSYDLDVDGFISFLRSGISAFENR